MFASAAATDGIEARLTGKIHVKSLPDNERVRTITLRIEVSIQVAIQEIAEVLNDGGGELPGTLVRL